jgi:hypothetical protein
MPDLNTLPHDLPRPEDDGACDHLMGMAMRQVALPSTRGATVDLAVLPPGRTVIYFYPLTGRLFLSADGETKRGVARGLERNPGRPGLHTAGLCVPRPLNELEARGAGVFGLSTQV